MRSSLPYYSRGNKREFLATKNREFSRASQIGDNAAAFFLFTEIHNVRRNNNLYYPIPYSPVNYWEERFLAKKRDLNRAIINNNHWSAHFLLMEYPIFSKLTNSNGEGLIHYVCRCPNADENMLAVVANSFEPAPTLDFFGNTPLFVAASLNRGDLVQPLVNLGFDPNHKNYFNQRALDLAYFCGSQFSGQVMINNGAVFSNYEEHIAYYYPQINQPYISLVRTAQNPELNFPNPITINSEAPQIAQTSNQLREASAVSEERGIETITDLEYQLPDIDVNNTIQLFPQNIQITPSKQRLEDHKISAEEESGYQEVLKAAAKLSNAMKSGGTSLES